MDGKGICNWWPLNGKHRFYNTKIPCQTIVPSSCPVSTMLYVPFASRHPNACSLSTYSNIRVGWSQVVFFGQLSWTGMYFSDNPQGCTVLHVALKDHKKNRAMLWKWLPLSQVQKVKIMMIWITSQKHLHTPKTQKKQSQSKRACNDVDHGIQTFWF